MKTRDGSTGESRASLFSASSAVQRALSAHAGTLRSAGQASPGAARIHGRGHPGRRGAGASSCSFPFLGRAYFPRTDPGQFVIDVRMPSGTRLEVSNEYIARVEKIIRET